MCADVPYRGGI